MVRRVREDEVLRLILEGTVSEIGTDFFRALVRNLSQALQTFGAWVTEYLPEERRLKSLAFWLDGDFVESYEYGIEGSPCLQVVEKKCLAHFPDRVCSLFPTDSDLARFGAVSYMGVPLCDTDGELLGHLAVIDRKPMPCEPHLVTVFEIFATRAAAEYRRLKLEERVHDRQEELNRLLDSALDAIVVFDGSFAITRVNPGAERVFRCRGAEALLGQDARRLLGSEGARELEARVTKLRGQPEGQRQFWFSGDLEAKRLDGSAFPAEATLSCFESRERPYHTLILRDANERLEAERQIRLLTDEAEYLRDALREGADFGEILGRSPPMEELLHAISRVAKTDATVLILGETGTGKELVARSIHRASRRSEEPLVRVNCAAIPGPLTESEFFGHEKGAFTGATARREGRFALADGGTIFLDEVGELPPEMQAKLLRVLQEGEFEPLGSTVTRKVNVRVIAATNRSPEEMVKAGTFRQDLFYRLNVFPLHVPPLRERGEDIGVLADCFVRSLSRRMGRRVEPLGPEDIRRLSLYAWPGNVRELQNVIERAIILSRGARLDLDRVLPRPAPDRSTVAAPEPESTTARILSADEMEALERTNILRALETASWRIAGQEGAARRLGLPPSTLNSRMKSLGIRRPRNGY
jgi:PAS domain S-box-containing protein